MAIFVFDTHCDTITTSAANSRAIADVANELSLASPMSKRWCQCFAIWLDDGMEPESAAAFYNAHVHAFAEQMQRYGKLVQQAFTAGDIERITAENKIAAVLTVENGSVLGGSLDRVAVLARDGVRAVTLTWNNANQLAGGQLSNEGFTDFGRAAVAELERYSIVADVSHLNERSFWELDGLAKRPYMASHSNSRSVYEHKRNLTDDQIRAVAARGGIVSATYHLPFIAAEDGSCDMLCRHIERIIKIGGEGAAALGSDFDGGKPPAWLSGSGDVPGFVESLRARFGDRLAARIAGGNALDFLRRYEEG